MSPKFERIVADAVDGVVLVSFGSLADPSLGGEGRKKQCVYIEKLHVAVDVG